MKRITFLKKTFGAILLAAPAYALLSCSSSDDSETDEPQSTTDCSSTGMNASTIAANHGHSIVVSAEDVANGIEKSYNIEGTAGHSHIITISAANFALLQNSEQIVINSSSGNNHSHQVTISCA